MQKFCMKDSIHLLTLKFNSDMIENRGPRSPENAAGFGQLKFVWLAASASCKTRRDITNSRRVATN